MKKIAVQGNLAQVSDYGPDPVMLRKSGQSQKKKKISNNYKKRLDDPSYMDFAINKIAVELLHFIQK